ncbi:cytoplasmic protein [Kwoniella mangroviensis CBS 10435]|uniref:Cytoplasmic protein n=1 Tax=Kwoniella mangroviensis CBS 10435 TaxID=1331196 RepID=A0A1B9J2S5_9TREE|nr:cytoplasmic protein [Kwoniella mangroviensis CBS 10435]
MTTPTPVQPVEAFVSFPSPYTQSLLVQALVSVLPFIKISLAPYSEDQPPALQWADYDLLSFDLPHSNPTKYLISSYVYRKALIRKHQLHSTIQAYLAKCQHRNIQSILSPEEGGVPKGWNVELQFLDELDELLLDDLYDLNEGMQRNEDLPEEERSWFILKPGFADRAQGIRMFSTEDELRAIFEEFEPPSSDEEDYEDEDQDQEEEQDGQIPQDVGVDGMIDMLAKKAVELGFDGDEEDDRHFGPPADRDDGEEEDGTGVMTSQLRHFVIQEYMPNPVLFDIAQQPNLPSPFLEGYKFHLRAYVLLTSAYTVHLSRTMLALFSGSPYTPPRSSKEGEELDLRPHLTNTCLQTDSFGAPAPPEELVKLFWELEGLDAMSSVKDGKYEFKGSVTKEWLEAVFNKSGGVVGEAVKAGAECGSFGLQFMPNAFEIFGVDLILSFPPTNPSSSSELPIPKVTLLEFNASADFHQSGIRLKKDLLEMFKGVIRISIAPFFGLKVNHDNDDEEEEAIDAKQDQTQKSEDWEVGEERWGWTLVGKGEVRGSGW